MTKLCNHVLVATAKLGGQRSRCRPSRPSRSIAARPSRCPGQGGWSALVDRAKNCRESGTATPSLQASCSWSARWRTPDTQYVFELDLAIGKRMHRHAQKLSRSQRIQIDLHAHAETR